MFPKRPWVRLHLDYAGPVNGNMFLVLIDAYSKWLEVKIASSASSSITIKHLRSICSTHGLPEVLVTDNGTCFTSQEFKDFTTRNRIRHVRTAPYHPTSNGQAERAVRIVKVAIKNVSKDSLETQLSRVLFHCRLTPQSTTGLPPAELLLGRRSRSQVDLAKPDLNQQVEAKQLTFPAQKGKEKEASLSIGSLVFIKNFCPGLRWLPGSITRASGPKSFIITLTDGRIVRRHVNHIRHRDPENNTEIIDEQQDDWTSLVPTRAPAMARNEAASASGPEQPVAVTPPNLPATLRRSSRQIRPPNYYSKESASEEGVLYTD